MRITLIAAISCTFLLLALLGVPVLVDKEYDLLLFVGRFHPLVLHIPIGALIGLFFLEMISRFFPKVQIGNAGVALLWFAALSTIPTVIAGFLLASGGGYNEDTLVLHQWLGWGTAFLCIWLLVFKQRSLSSTKSSQTIYHGFLTLTVILISLTGHFGGSLTHGSSYLTQHMPNGMKDLLGVEDVEAKLLAIQVRNDNPEEALRFTNQIQPILADHCFQCHGPKKQKGDIRLDVLDWDMINGPDAEGWHSALDMINSGEMPPKDEKQLSNENRRQLVDWITNSLDEAAIIKKKNYEGSMRRLTKKQYTSSLNELLGVSVNFGDVLPDDGKSAMGFSNNAEILQVSSLHIDYYQKIAREALDKAIVLGKKPPTYNYRVTMGKGIGVGKPSAEFRGYQTNAIKSDDILVDVLDGKGKAVSSANEDKESKINATKSKIGIGMRGSASERFKIVEEGLILSSALPAKETVPKSWQGPSPNMKMLINEEFPREGDFVFRVVASKGYPYQIEENKLISLRKHVPKLEQEKAIVLSAKDCQNTQHLRLVDKKWLVTTDVSLPAEAKFEYHVPQTGYYMVELVHPYAPDDAMPSYTIGIFGRKEKLSERLYIDKGLKDKGAIKRPISLAYLIEGKNIATIGGNFFVGFSEIILTPISADDPLPELMADEAKENFKKYETINPSIRSFAGSRTDDGMDYRTFDSAKVVTAKFGEWQTIEFHGRLENLPIPNDVSLTSGDLAGIFTLGLWNDHLVKDPSFTGPPLLIKSVEFEAPYFPVWPPKSHTNIFFDAPRNENEEVYTAAVLSKFMEKAFRRPAESKELERYMSFWKQIKNDFNTYEESVKEVLVAILCSPSFLYIYEPEKAEIEEAPDYYLASQLSYFLWNTSPDETLLDLADRGKLVRNLDDQVERMIDNPRIVNMVESFAYDWLRVDRHQNMNTDVDMYEDYTRFVKEDMVNETYHFISYLLKENMSILNFIDSDFAMLNQNLAEFYGIKGVLGSEFRPVKLTKNMNRGGLLSQGTFLNGHSDGVQAHPIKRAVWLKEKILGDPSPPPPPNVPELDPDIPGIEQMTLKDQLFLHRNKASCMDCHKKIDPFGVVFENYDAVGRFQTLAKGKPIDSKSVLPDGEVVEGIQGIKEYILTMRSREFTRAFVEHLYAYALGRDISFADEKEIDKIVEEVIDDDYRFHTVIKEIVSSPSFSKNQNKSWLALLGL